MIIIDGRQKRKVKAVESTLTALGWTYVLVTSFQVVLSLIVWYFNLTYLAREIIFIGEIKDTVRIVVTTFVLAFAASIILYGWGHYNYKKYGQLNRRSFPQSVTPAEKAIYFNLDETTIKDLQNARIIKLDKTIV